MNRQESALAIELVTKLMAIPGKSCEELLVASEVRAILAAAGVKSRQMIFDKAHRRTPLKGEVGNLIVRIPGGRGLPRILLSAHLDTVPICVGCEPIRKGKFIRSEGSDTGLGADDRAGVATILFAALTALQQEESRRPPLTLCFFVQEEIGLQGSRQLDVAKLGKPALAFNFDGGNPFKLTVGATGGERLEIRLQGVSSHAGIAPAEGASAIAAAGLAIAKLQRGKWLGAVSRRGRKGTSNIGVIEGGVATNVVAEHVVIKAEARSHDSQFRDAIASAIETAFIEAAALVKTTSGQAVKAQVDRRVDYESFRLEDDAAPVQLAEKAIKSLGKQPESALSAGGVDANWLVRHGIPTVTLGCGQRNVHTNQESLYIPDFLAACDIAKRIVCDESR